MDSSSPAWEPGGLPLQVNAVEPFSSYWLSVTSEPAGVYGSALPATSMACTAGHLLKMHRLFPG